MKKFESRNLIILGLIIAIIAVILAIGIVGFTKVQEKSLTNFEEKYNEEEIKEESKKAMK